MGLINEKELKEKFEPKQAYFSESIFRKIEATRVECVLCKECVYMRETTSEYHKTVDDEVRYFCEREMPRREVEKDGFCKWGEV